ncbi:MAG: transglutaminase-like domain-containing protein [Pseudomonas sp.]|uniref:transglutaminase-like domain-containing protein n=1 Tax=Pseudomonas sp. TaxID=306 RepID=UPI003397651E
MIKHTCSIITAISLVWSVTAPAFELAVRVRNDSAALVSGARLCGVRPLALNGVAYRWQVARAEGPALAGNPYCLALEPFGPYQSQQIRLQWQPLAPDEGGGKAYTPDYDLTAAPSPQLLALAERFGALPETSRVAAIHQWMVDNIVFSGIRRGIDGAEHALLNGQGDCTEHMLLAGELLQRNGFTIRRVLGVAVDKDRTHITASSLHNWIEYQDNGTWLVFDSSRRVLGSTAQQHYIALMFYQNSHQLGLEPLVLDSSRLQLYLR